MEFFGRQLNVVSIVVALFFNLITTGQAEPFALVTLSNAVPTNLPASPKPAMPKVELATNQILPAIKMYDVPIRAGIENLTRLAQINYIIDARVEKWWSRPGADGKPVPEPTLNFSWKNLTAKEALERLLGEHHLVLADDPLTAITRITYTNQVVNPGDAKLLGEDTNIIPIIKLQDVPITTFLENLARLAGISYALDPKIGYGMPDKYGQIKTEPTLSLRWAHITATQALIAICENYDLVILKDPTSSIVLIRAKNHPITNFSDAGLLESDTNEAGLVQMQDVRLDNALRQLAKKANIEVSLDPALSGDNITSKDGIAPQPVLSFRWEGFTPMQAIIALCENYDYVIAKDSATDIIRIKPKD